MYDYIPCQIVQETIEKVASFDHKKLKDYIATREKQTINGPITFDRVEGSLPGMVLQYQKGEQEIIWPPEAATAKPLYPKPPWPKKK